MRKAKRSHARARARGIIRTNYVCAHEQPWRARLATVANTAVRENINRRGGWNERISGDGDIFKRGIDMRGRDELDPSVTARSK